MQPHDKDDDKSKQEKLIIKKKIMLEDLPTIICDDGCLTIDDSVSYENIFGIIDHA